MKNNNQSRTKNGAYGRLTPSLAFQLAAPHTWVAALVPVMVSYVYCAITYSGKLNTLYAFILLLICVLMQSAVNVFNDYFDYVKGTDSEDNSSDDAFDAVLVYNNINPRSALALAIAYLAAAGLLGVYLTLQTSVTLLIIGIVGALIVVLYSGGKTPISYLPIGEAVSGIVMGGLIPLACCYALSGILAFEVLLVSVPLMIGIGLVLFTNNSCDIEKDIAAKRRTIAVLLGRDRVKSGYNAALCVWILAIVALIGIFYSSGMPFVLMMMLCAFPAMRALVNNPLIARSRDGAMAQIVTLNVIFGTFYCLAMAAPSFVAWV